VKSRRTKQFKKLFDRLPSHVQDQAKVAYSHFKHDPHYPSLHFKCIDPKESRYSVRIGPKYRALGIMAGDEITWDWIGPHDKYDHMI